VVSSLDADNTAGSTPSGVSSFQALLVASLSQIVSPGMDDDAPADDRVGADQLEVLVGDVQLHVSRGIGLDIAKITNVTVLGVGCSVRFVVGVEMRASGGTSV